MAKNVNRIQLVRSNVIENNLPKLPSASALLEGELAVNYAADKEVLATKNSSGEVVTFSSDKYYTEKKLGDLFSGDTTVTEVILDNELVTATALNDLNSRKLDKDDYQPTDLSNYYTKSETYSKTEVNNLIPDVDGYFDGAEYNSNDKKIYFKHGNDVISAATIDATDFIKDGMVSSAYTSAVTESGETINYLYIEFNTDAGKETIAINLDEIIDPDNYYTKQQIDDAEMVVSAALNDLESRKLDASAYTPTDLSEYYTKNEIDEISSGHLTTAKFEEKLGSGFTGENSATTITEVIEHNEFVTSAALNDLNIKVGSGFSNSSITEVVSTTVLGLSTLFDTYLPRNEFETKIGSSFTGSNSATTITSYLDEKELVISSALNDLNTNKLDVSAYTPTDLSNYYTKAQVDGLIPSVDGYFDGVSYDSDSHIITFSHSGSSAATLDATAFIKDGMVNSAYTSAVTDSETSAVTNYIMIEFNTDAGKDTIAINVDEIIDPDNYYTKQDIDDAELVISSALNDLETRKLDASALTEAVSDFVTSEDLEDYATNDSLSAYVLTTEFEEKLGSGFTGANSANTITKVIIDNELVVSAALNDLNSRKLDASAYTEFSPTDYYTTAQTDTLLSSKADTATTYTKTEVDNLIPTVDSVLDSGSTNALQNKAVYDAYVSATTYDNTFSYSGSSGSTNAVEAQALAKYLDEKELVVASALTDLDARLQGVAYSADVETFVDGVADTMQSMLIELSGAVEDLQESQITVDSVFDEEHSSASTHAVEAQALFEYINEIDLGTASALNDLNTRLGSKQDTLVSGVNIKTINNIPLIGEGNIVLEGSGGGGSTLPNADILSSITQTQINGWNTASNNSHTHSNRTVLDGITTAKTANWDTVTAKTDNTAFTAHTADTTAHVTSAEKTAWNGKVSAITMNGSSVTVTNGTANLGTVLTSFTETDPTVPSWAKQSTKPTYTASEVGALPTGTTLDDIVDGTTRKLSNYSLTSHTHSEYATTATVNTLSGTVTAHTADTTVHVTSGEKSTWNGKQDALSNASVLTGITSTKVSNWDDAATDSHTHANKGVIDGITTAKTQQWDNAISAVSFNGRDATITNHKAAITATIPTVSDATIILQFGSNTSAFTVNQGSNLTINLATLIGIPAPTASDNGKILGVVNGAFAWITPTTIYTGTGTPSSSQGNDGDIYLQTS